MRHAVDVKCIQPETDARVDEQERDTVGHEKKERLVAVDVGC